MPVNYQEIQNDVKSIGQNAPAQQKLRLERLCLARDLLRAYADNQAGLDGLRAAATHLAPGLRCAVPGCEPLTFCGTPSPDGIPYILLAADGSQINPDRQRPGRICRDQYRRHSHPARSPRNPPGNDQLQSCCTAMSCRPNFGPLTEEIVAMRRDSNERTLLAWLAAKETLPVVTLTDGQLELFREPQPTREFERHFTEFKEALRELASFQRRHRRLCR